MREECVKIKHKFREQKMSIAVDLQWAGGTVQYSICVGGREGDREQRDGTDNAKLSLSCATFWLLSVCAQSQSGRNRNRNKNHCPHSTVAALKEADLVAAVVLATKQKTS